MIETERLTVREWHEGDRAPLAAMRADPEVMRFLGPPRDQAAADAEFDRYVSLSSRDFHPWAVERRADNAFLGTCGLNRVDHGVSPVNGSVEIGWKLARAAWGRGFAAEAAAAALASGFATGLDRIVAFTVAANTRSWGLMERLGMTRRADLDFDHPALAADDPLRPHIVYSIDRNATA